MTNNQRFAAELCVLAVIGAIVHAHAMPDAAHDDTITTRHLVIMSDDGKSKVAEFTNNRLYLYSAGKTGATSDELPPTCVSADGLTVHEGRNTAWYSAHSVRIQNVPYGVPLAELGVDNEAPKYGTLSVVRADGTVRVGGDPQMPGTAIDVRHFKSEHAFTRPVSEQACSSEGLAPLKAEVNQWSK